MKPVYLQRDLHGQNHHLGGKSLIDIEFYIKPVGGGGVVVCKNVNYSNMSTKVLSKTYIRSYHTCICLKKVMWGLVAASQL